MEIDKYSNSAECLLNEYIFMFNKIDNSTIGIFHICSHQLFPSHLPILIVFHS